MQAEIQNQYLRVEGLLTPEELQSIDAILASAEFVDGSATASDAAKSVKHNEQLPDGIPLIQIQNIIQKAISSSPLIQAAIMPSLRFPYSLVGILVVCLMVGM